MSRQPIDILNLFINFPGDTLFFLLVSACSQVALFIAYGHRSRFPLERSTRRYVMASAALVFVWLMMLSGAVLALYGDLDANRYLPPMERLAFAVTLLLMGWAFLSADFSNWQYRSNLIIFGAAFLLTLLFISTARGWLADYAAGLAFNATEYALLWTAATGCIAAAALLLTVLNTRHIIDAPLKALFFFLFVAGSMWDLLQFSQGELTGNYQGAARLAYAGALILLPVIIHRLAVALLENSLVEVMLAVSQMSESVDTDQTADSMPPDGASAFTTQHVLSRLTNAIGAMLDMDDPEPAPMRVVKATAAALPVDMCALLLIKDDSAADVLAGWDTAREQALTSASVNMIRQPTLLAAAKRGDATTLLPDHHTEELRDLFQHLAINGLGSLVAQPLAGRGEDSMLLLVSSPYQRADLAAPGLALLTEIASVAGHPLRWQSKPDQDKASVQPQTHSSPETEQEPAEPPPADAIPFARRELTAGLRDAGERTSHLQEQISGLEKQLGDEQTRLLDHLAQNDKDASRRAQAHSALCERQLLLDRCDASARALLDAEAALRLLNDQDSLESSAQEYMHKRYNILLNVRDRMRRQINDLAIIRRSSAGDAHAALIQQLSDDRAQLALQRDQLRRRRDSVIGQLSKLGVGHADATMLPPLTQLHAERQAWRTLLVKANTRQHALQAELQALLETDAGNRLELESQLKKLAADHDALLESRETLRRDQQALREKLNAAVTEKDAIAEEMRQLGCKLTDEETSHKLTRTRVDALERERDNLLGIRDKLTAKVAELLDQGSLRDDSGAVAQELEELRATVARLSQQREDLALDLTDARLELAQTPLAPESSVAGPNALLAMLRELGAPIAALRAHLDLLLTESLGILGAAQLEVLRLATAEMAEISSALSIFRQMASAQIAGNAGQTPIDVAGMLNEVIADAGARYAGKSLLFDLSLEDAVAPLSVDCAGLEHILTQLIINACEASPPGAQVRISANAGRIMLPGAKESIDALSFRVQDAGGGISSSDYPRIFARTYRAAYPALKGLGDNGVGMSVARAIARAQKGDVWATSESSRGATFHFALPLPPATSSEA